MSHLGSKNQKKTKVTSNGIFFPKRTGKSEQKYLSRKIKEGKVAEVNERFIRAFNTNNAYLTVLNRMKMKEILEPVPKYNETTIAGRRSAKKGIKKPELYIKTMFENKKGNNSAKGSMTNGSKKKSNIISKNNNGKKNSAKGSITNGGKKKSNKISKNNNGKQNSTTKSGRRTTIL